MRTKVLLVLAMTVASVTCFGQKVRRVSGEFEMRIESNMSENQAIQQATQQARITALAAEFGTRVGAINQTRIENAGNNTNTSFTSISNSLVKGIWLKDLSEPQIDKFDQNGDRWIKVSVDGRARGLDNSGIGFEVQPLNCDQYPACKEQEFNQNEDLLLYFRSPENGYLSVYLDDKSTSYLVLPYKGLSGGSVPVEADKKYIFFKATDKHNYFNQDLTGIDEYALYTPYDYEVDLLYVFFSKEPFSRPILDDNGEQAPKSTTSEKFNEWVGEIMSYENMYMEVIDITISN